MLITFAALKNIEDLTNELNQARNELESSNEELVDIEYEIDKEQNSENADFIKIRTLKSDKRALKVSINALESRIKALHVKIAKVALANAYEEEHSIKNIKNKAVKHILGDGDILNNLSNKIFLNTIGWDDIEKSKAETEAAKDIAQAQANASNEDRKSADNAKKVAESKAAIEDDLRELYKNWQTLEIKLKTLNKYSPNYNEQWNELADERDEAQAQYETKERKYDRKYQSLSNWQQDLEDMKYSIDKAISKVRKTRVANNNNLNTKQLSDLNDQLLLAINKWRIISKMRSSTNKRAYPDEWAEFDNKEQIARDKINRIVKQMDDIDSNYMIKDKVGDSLSQTAKQYVNSNEVFGDKTLNNDNADKLDKNSLKNKYKQLFKQVASVESILDDDDTKSYAKDKADKILDDLMEQINEIGEQLTNYHHVDYDELLDLEMKGRELYKPHKGWSKELDKANEEDRREIVDLIKEGKLWYIQRGNQYFNGDSMTFTNGNATNCTLFIANSADEALNVVPRNLKNNNNMLAIKYTTSHKYLQNSANLEAIRSRINGMNITANNDNNSQKSTSRVNNNNNDDDEYSDLL